MTWEWSHSSEAYNSAYENLHQCDREFLEVCFAEIKAARYRGNGHWELNLQRYAEYLPFAKTLANETLADAIWEFARKLRECDNGGYNAYVCPFHCHEVSFSEVKPSEEAYSHEAALLEDARELGELYQEPEFDRDF
jgi:hypothetical protein